MLDVMSRHMVAVMAVVFVGGAFGSILWRLFTASRGEADLDRLVAETKAEREAEQPPPVAAKAKKKKK